MYTGGGLLGTFAGPGKSHQVIKVEGSALTGRYILIQMNNRECLHLHEVEAFGSVITTTTTTTSNGNDFVYTRKTNKSILKCFEVDSNIKQNTASIFLKQYYQQENHYNLK